MDHPANNDVTNTVTISEDAYRGLLRDLAASRAAVFELSNKEERKDEEGYYTAGWKDGLKLASGVLQAWTDEAEFFGDSLETDTLRYWANRIQGIGGALK